jgi:hypothetical protein
MGNPGSSPTANLPYPGGTSTLGNPEFPAHTTPTNPNLNFRQPYYKTMAYGPNIPPTGMGVPHGPIPDIFFPRTPAYITPNPRVEGEVNDGVRDQIARISREFGFTPKGQSRSYQKPYLEDFDTIPYPQGFWVPDLAFASLAPYLRDKSDGQEFFYTNQLLQRVLPYENRAKSSQFRENANKDKEGTTLTSWMRRLTMRRAMRFV